MYVDVCEGGESGMCWVCAWGVGGCVGVYGGVGVCVWCVCVCRCGCCICCE